MKQGSKKWKLAVEEAVKEIQRTRGKGILRAIVWSEPYAGLERGTDGLVVCQLQYGFYNAPFTVEVTGGLVKVTHLGVRRFFINTLNQLLPVRCIGQIRP